MRLGFYMFHGRLKRLTCTTCFQNLQRETERVHGEVCVLRGVFFFLREGSGGCARKGFWVGCGRRTAAPDRPPSLLHPTSCFCGPTRLLFPEPDSTHKGSRTVRPCYFPTTYPLYFSFPRQCLSGRSSCRRRVSPSRRSAMMTWRRP